MKALILIDFDPASLRDPTDQANVDVWRLVVDALDDAKVDAVVHLLEQSALRQLELDR